MKRILRELIDKKVSSILIIFLENKKQLFHLRKISEESKVPITTTFRIIRKLTNLKIITIVKVGKLKLYKLAQNKNAKILEELIKK